ncbi:MAG: MerR family DNA-binding protein [Burkholderiales bacterium]|nr:MerR family DNA-binding protein [Burkholderiales bacterium]
MKIGDLATASSGGFRVYEAPHLERLQFIRYCRGLDMSLDEVRVLLRVKDAPGSDCGDVNALLDEHIGHVSRRIKELRALEKQLKELRQRCGVAQGADQCGILNGLAAAAQEGGAQPVSTGSGAHLRSVHNH